MVATLNARGYGFIKPVGTQGAENVLFHASDLADDLDFRELHVGQPVAFEVDVSPRGPRAAIVQPDR